MHRWNIFLHRKSNLLLNVQMLKIVLADTEFDRLQQAEEVTLMLTTRDNRDFMAGPCSGTK